ncbi:hypothetical protein GOOTI_152_00130 [Gordonia otitidis NBRC 100426]|uniref:Uncharacterized protein n=1 Tax=Gordonia otitidis (strain DSM 44809 / CCUG 52243 / JCM 12355 / NBRC 100426 / IFM 10032) TaxID=1108044 RepID=H5TP56_GORO1|nr:hypothetical protein GOOTI_152_00130 [Gordonia otitidis NBRC 100426]
MVSDAVVPGVVDPFPASLSRSPSTAGIPIDGIGDVPDVFGVVGVVGLVGVVEVPGAANAWPAPATIAAITAIATSPNSLIRLISNFCTTLV